MEFFLDSNIPYSSIKVFEKFNYNVQHARIIGMGKSSDKEIIDYAFQNNMILVTRDVGFGNIIDYPIESHKGVIVLRLPFYFNSVQINKTLLNFLESIEEKEIKNSLIILDIKKYRIRR
ncbi:MAG: DUF5615 family PIN-like protein [Nanoarchaeota archaeon]|nr:DUF5615 family PIN-like protein [Nanoarchaeota archaeon]